jgi:hypothetical protein
MPGIGILSSIPFQGTVLETAFNSGLPAGFPPYRNYQDDKGWNPATLIQALAALNNDPQGLTVIAATGGMAIEAAALAAVTGAQIDFVTVVGGPPNGTNPPSGHFKNRLSLGSFVNNLHRRAYLHTNFGIAPQEVCLLYNQSDMTGHETPGFQHVQPVTPTLDRNTTPAQAQQAFAAAFTSISQMINPAVRAVIVSADPFFFRYFPNQLVSEANTWVNAVAGRRICYPIQEYDAVPAPYGPPQPGKTTCWGAPLYYARYPSNSGAGYAVPAYTLLGQMAANAGNPNPVTVEQLVRDI